MLTILLLMLTCTSLEAEEKSRSENSRILMALSQDLLYAVKVGESTEGQLRALSNYTVEDISTALSDDASRKCFWINLYNASFQILAKRGLRNPEIFKVDALQLKDAVFSLDDMEHGILRRYRWKYSMGYLPKLFPGKDIRALAVKEIDFRIHFALNCGAKSCPPIAFYELERLDEQLEMATRSFLETDTEVDDATKTVKVSRIMSWFKADFGGKKGIRVLLKKHLPRDVTGYKLQFKEYDWTSILDNYLLQ
jgi:hypothetical protein